jgi:D-ribose pyranose/furanose isomerase RbsD
MKSLFTYSVVFFLLFIAACKQDFDVTSKYLEVPVVYGLLNQQDGVHYLRIQKGYLIDGNALVAAGISDSIYYNDNLNVKITALYNGNPSGSFTLKKVDGDTLTPPIQKEPGTFSSSPNILYAFTGTLDPAKTYKLEVTNTGSGKTISSQTLLIKDFQVLVPTKGSKLNITSNNPPKVVWYAAENGNIYDLTVRFNYLEFDQTTNALLKDTFVDMVLLKSYVQDNSTTNITAEFSGDVLLHNLASHIEARTDVYRTFNITKGMQVKVAVGGQDLANYLNAQLAQGGLASNEALPPYTNITNGVGLFSSRYFKQIDSVLLSNDGLDSLACSSVSAQLRFKNHIGQICY